METTLLWILWIIGGIFTISFIYYTYLKGTVKTVFGWLGNVFGGFAILFILCAIISWCISTIGAGDVRYVDFFGSSIYWMKFALILTAIAYILTIGINFLLALMGFIIGSILVGIVQLILLPFGVNIFKREAFTNGMSAKNYNHMSWANGYGKPANQRF